MADLNVTLVIIKCKSLERQYCNSSSAMCHEVYLLYLTYFFMPELYDISYHYFPFHVETIEAEVLKFNFHLQIFQTACSRTYCAKFFIWTISSKLFIFPIFKLQTMVKVGYFFTAYTLEVELFLGYLSKCS